jgi:hypothetical protein
MVRVHPHLLLFLTFPSDEHVDAAEHLTAMLKSRYQKHLGSNTLLSAVVSDNGKKCARRLPPVFQTFLTGLSSTSAMPKLLYFAATTNPWAVSRTQRSSVFTISSIMTT